MPTGPERGPVLFANLGGEDRALGLGGSAALPAAPRDLLRGAHAQHHVPVSGRYAAGYTTGRVEIREVD